MKVSHTTENTNELLGHMYRNVQMGSESLCDVLPKITDKFLVTNVTSQMERYAGYTSRTAAELRKRSAVPQELSGMKKAMAKGGIAMNTLFDSSDRHIAQMIEKGTRMGVDELEGQLVRLTKEGCDMEVTALSSSVPFKPSPIRIGHPTVRGVNPFSQAQYRCSMAFFRLPG